MESSTQTSGSKQNCEWNDELSEKAGFKVLENEKVKI